MKHSDIYLSHYEKSDGSIRFYSANNCMHNVCDGIRNCGRNYEEGITIYDATPEAFDYISKHGYWEFVPDEETARKKKDHGESQYKWLMGNGDMQGTRLDWITLICQKNLSGKKVKLGDGELVIDGNIVKSIDIVSNGYIKVHFKGVCLTNFSLSDKAVIDICSVLMLKVEEKLIWEKNK